MVRTVPPVCLFGTPAIDFKLLDTAGKTWTLADCRGENGLVVMFICNHCPYVRAILEGLVADMHILLDSGIKSVAIMPNDIRGYPMDSLDHMRKIAQEYQFPFPYLYDESQETARAYAAVCTPDFFGYNKDMQLQYRGRFDNRENKTGQETGTKHELLIAMQEIAQTGKGPSVQIPNLGCSIKWK